MALLWRGGREQEALAHLAGHRVALSADSWFAPLNWASAAQTTLYAGDADLASEVYALLVPYAGRCAAAGSGNACGPFDAYLAFAAAARGDRHAASAHADEAERLCDEWGIPIALAWFRSTRSRYGF